MDVLAVLVVIGLTLVSFPVGGPLVALTAMALLDFPSGSRQVATDFIDGGGWVLLLLSASVMLGIALHFLRQRRAVKSPALPHDTGSAP